MRGKRRATLFLALVCTATALLALFLLLARSPLGTSAPVPLRTVGSATVDLGVLDQNEQRPFRFTVRNLSSEPVLLGRVWTTCGCTVLKLDRESVDPGETFQVHGRPDTSQAGTRRADVFVERGAGAEAFHIGEVRFRVRSGWLVHPPQPELRIDDKVRRGAEMPVTLIADEGRRVEGQVEVNTPCPGLDLKQSVRGDTVRITPVIADPAAVPYGHFAVPIEVVSDSRNAPRFRVDLQISHHPRLVRTEPAVLASPVTPQGTDIRYRFRLLFRGVPAIVRAVACWSDVVTVRSWASETPGTVDVTLQPDPELSTSRAVVLILTTDRAKIALNAVLAMRPASRAEEDK